MAIYDNNGTTSTQIAKVYDNNGTTSTQIGKIYDNNGTTSSLIYTAQTPENPIIFDHGSYQSSIASWNMGKSGGDYWYFLGFDSETKSIRIAQTARTGHDVGYTYTDKKVNISGYSKLRMEYAAYQGYGDAPKSKGWSFLVLTNSVGVPVPIIGEPLPFNSNVVKGAVTFTSNTDKTNYTLDLDISGVDGSYYIEAGQRVQIPGATFHMEIYKIYFIE